MSPSKTSANVPTTGTLLLIDGHSLAFRSFYGVPAERFSLPTGQHTNAIHGFMMTLLTILADERPTHLAVAFDLPGGTFRTEAYSEYKGGRQPTPPEFAGQIDLIQDILSALNIRMLTKVNYEADDIIATLARSGEESGLDVLVCSGDRDAFQTITEHCTVLYPIKGELRRTDAQVVLDSYGVKPSMYPDMAALVGEKADNLPGVPGVGPKTAAKWLTTYGGLQQVINNAAEIGGKAGQSLRDHLDDVRRNRELNALVTDLDLGLDSLEELRLEMTLDDAARELLTSLRMRRVLARLETEAVLTAQPATSSGAEGASSAASFLDELSVRRIDSVEQSLTDILTELVAQATDHGTPLALRVSGDSRPAQGDAQEVCIASRSQAVIVSLQDCGSDNESTLAAFLETPPVDLIMTDAKGAWHALRGRGLSLGDVAVDLSIAGYLCEPDARSYTVEALADQWLELSASQWVGLCGDDAVGTSADDVKKLLAKGLVTAQQVMARETALLFPLHERLMEELEARGAATLLSALEMPVADCLASMEDAGIRMDEEALSRIAEEYDRRVQDAQRRAYDAAGHELNLSSPMQLQTVLFDELDMPKTRKTKRGYTTNADALTDLFARTGHPFLEAVLDHRDAIKMRQIVEGLRKATQPDGRIHTSFQQTVAATGRLSSIEPNLQNIPARTEEGARLREAFLSSSEEHVLLTADYSQIEMRIMAHLSGDASLIEAFTAGEDLHRSVASIVHGIPYGDVTPDQRSHIKAMSYGLVYGLSTYGLAKQLGISNMRAKSLQEAYFARLWRVRDYLESVVEEAERTGYTTTIFGRRRYLPDLRSSSGQRREVAKRAALNAPIQGSAADIVKKAMIDVADKCREAGYEARLVLQVHDELILDVPRSEIDAVRELVVDTMEHAVELSVPLSVSAGVGETWRGAAH